MSVKWYIEINIIACLDNYWNDALEKIHYDNNLYYIITRSMTSEFIKEILSTEQYETIMSIILSLNLDNFTYRFRIPEETLLLMKLKNSDIINFHLELGNIFEGDNLEEGIIIHDEIY